MEIMAMNSAARMPHFQEVLDRVFQVTGWRKAQDLAELLEITPQAVSGAKHRGLFPIEWAFKIAQAFNVSTDWLLTGKTPEEIDIAGCACPYSSATNSPITQMDQGNLKRLAREIHNMLDKQGRQIDQTRSLLKAIVRIADGRGKSC